MKKIITGFGIAFLILNMTPAFAQIRKVPAAVTDAFKSKYPNAAAVEWGDKVTVFEATFDQDDHKHQASFNSSGEWKFTETFISETELPASVKDAFDKSKYNDWEIKSYVDVVEASGAHQYRLYVKKNDLQKKFLYFNTDGVLAKDEITL